MSRILPRYEPMLATPWVAPPTEADGWVHEVKWDGVRIILEWDGEAVRLRSRRGTDATTTYPELTDIAFDEPCVLDGEVVSLDSADRPSFERLQARMNVSSPTADALAAVPISFVVFDLLFAGEPLIGMPWHERRGRLESFPMPDPLIATDVFAGDPGPIWDIVVARNLEGVVSKQVDSLYRPGTRSPDWRKTANRKLMKAVVCGYTQGEGGRAPTLGSLVLGLSDEGSWRWVGAVGSGLSDAALGAIRSSLDEMVSDVAVLDDPMLPKGITWVEPRLVAVVEFKEWTGGGRLRAPVFKGFTRDDPGEISWTSEGPT